VFYTGAVNLSDWADQVGVSKFTAYRWFREGTLPVPAQRVGRLILVDTPSPEKVSNRTVCYARVSSHDQRGDLDRQVARITSWATAHGLQVAEVVTEVGSGVNAERRKLARLLADPKAQTIIVEHRDRLARFGVEHLQAALGAQCRSIQVVEDGEVDDDLLRDMTEVLTWFCARLYGRGGARNRALRSITAAKQALAT